MAARLRCQNRQFHRNIAPADCLYGSGDEKLQRALTNDAAKLDRRLQVACAGANLAMLGFPGTCTDPTTGDAFTTADLETCVVNKTDVVIAALLTSYVPDPSSDFHRQETSCIRGTAKDAFAMFRFDLRTRDNCLLDQQSGKIDDTVDCRALILPYGPGTKDEHVDRRVRRAYVHLLGGIPAVCSRVPLDQLGYDNVCDIAGGVLTVFELKVCLFNENLAQVLEALAIPFPTAPVCGNGRVEGDEQCDNGASNSNDIPNACRTKCRNAYCGDHVVDTGEQCDDGNTVSGDGCTATCTTENCGDGVVQSPGETCDDANTSNTDACVNCQDARCGDSFVHTGVEQCDDGNSSNTDSCLNTCVAATCGDGFVDAGVEQCDNGANNSNSLPNACRTDCRNAHCGDGVVDTPEVCDDGNSVNGDGCDTNCTVSACGNGVVGPPEQCDGSAAGCSGDDICMYNCKCGQPCPGFGELTLYAGFGDTCVTTADCPVGECDTGLGRCRTRTQLDSGWKGLAHDADIDNLMLTNGFLDCASKGPTCGVCNVAGLDPGNGACRCSNDTRTVCDQPFAADATHCGGATCNCYFGSPFPLSSAGTPACVVNRFSEDIAGTADVDLGAGHISARLRTEVYLGISTSNPCPVCGGRCSNDSSTICMFDEDCVGGTCQLDPVMNDGVRGGVCTDGRNVGLDCDVTGLSTSFPARPSQAGGGGYSLDCLPDIGKNVSGAGLAIKLEQTTGVTQLASSIPCGSGVGVCPCRVCTSDTTFPCGSDAECSSQPNACKVYSKTKYLCTTNADCKLDLGTCGSSRRCTKEFAKTCTTNADCNPGDVGPCFPSTCTSDGAGVPTQPNDCDNQDCSDAGGGEGLCTTGPDSISCDALVRAGGEGILSCNTNEDCSAASVGVDAGTCTLVARRPCFVDPLVATGQASPTAPIGAAVFCIPPTSAASINSVAGLPGPGRTTTQAGSKLFCAGDSSKRYIPGVGGCVP